MSQSYSRRRFIHTSLTAAVGVSSLAWGAGVAAQGIRGRMAPELSVSHWIDGKGEVTESFSVHANKGKWVYLKCFQDWCPSCHSIGFPNLQKLKAAFPGNDQVVAAVIQTTFEGHSINTVGALRKNQLRYNLDLPFGHDAGDTSLPDDNPLHYPSTMVNFQTRGTPWVVIVDPQGRVAFSDFHVDMDKLIAFLNEQTG